jgi:hypothetical protein
MCLRVCGCAHGRARAGEKDWKIGKASGKGEVSLLFWEFQKGEVTGTGNIILPQLMQLQLMAMDGSGVCGGKELACVTEKAPPIKCALPCAR